MRRGRRPLGTRLVDHLEGSRGAKERLRVILQTLSGELSVAEAEKKLGIGEAGFHKLRSRWLAEAVQALEPGPLGRPPRERSIDPERVEELERDNEELKGELEAARIREQIALVMPHVLKKTPRAKKPNSSRRTPKGAT